LENRVSIDTYNVNFQIALEVLSSFIMIMSGTVGKINLILFHVNRPFIYMLIWSEYNYRHAPRFISEKIIFWWRRTFSLCSQEHFTFL